MGDITQLLDEARAGRAGANDALFSRIYGELTKLARSKLAGAPPITLLDAPALVHDAYLRLTQQGKLLPAQNRHLFFGYAANIMRSVIVDCIREKRAAKRGDGVTVVTLLNRDLDKDLRNPDAEALDDALRDLERVNQRCREIVEMRYFAGLSVETIAGLMELSPATVKRDWQKARAFLYDALKD